MVHTVADEERPIGVEPEGMRLREGAGEGIIVAVGAAGSGTGDALDGSAFWIDLPDYMVFGVGNVNGLVGGDGDSFGTIDRRFARGAIVARKSFAAGSCNV